MSQQPVVINQEPVITVDDVTRLDFVQNRRAGSDRAFVHQDSAAQTVVYRIAPGSGVPTHQHSSASDFFVGVKGLLEIRYEGPQGSGTFELKPGGFCALQSGVRHEVFNPSDIDEAYFLLMHAPHEGFDFVLTQFQQLQPKLD